MNKVILSSLALLGLSVAFVAPAQAQTAPTNVLVNSPTGGASITGATVIRNKNGLTSAAAVQVTFPNTHFAEGGVVTPVYSVDPVDVDSIAVVTSVTVEATTLTVQAAPTGNTVEGATAALIEGSTSLGEQVSLIRAWRSGLN